MTNQIEYLVKKRPIHKEGQIMNASQLEPGKQYLGMRTNPVEEGNKEFNFTYIGQSNIKGCVEIKSQDGTEDTVSLWVLGINPIITDMWYKSNYVIPTENKGEKK